MYQNQLHLRRVTLKISSNESFKLPFLHITQQSTLTERNMIHAQIMIIGTLVHTSRSHHLCYIRHVAWR